MAPYRNMCLVEGPPGTGKTNTIKSIIQEFLEKVHAVGSWSRNCNPILVCAPSNAALDNIIDRLGDDILGEWVPCFSRSLMSIASLH